MKPTDIDDDEQVRAAYARLHRRSAVFAAVVVALGLLTMAFSLLMSVPRPSWFVIAWSLMTFLLLGTEYATWRCPRCRAYMGRALHADRCRECRVWLRESAMRAGRSLEMDMTAEIPPRRGNHA